MSLKARKRGMIAAVAVAVLGLFAAVPGPALATFPGRPGLLVFNLTFHGSDHSTFAGGLYSIRPGQKHPRLLTSNPLDYEPSFDPSGKRLVFRRLAAPPRDSSINGLYALDLSNGTTTKLTSGQSDKQPSLGPDGMVAFSRFSSDGGSYDLFLRTRSGNLRRLTSDTVADEEPVFTPDGDRIIFTQVERHIVALKRTGEESQGDGLYSIRTDGSRLRKLGDLQGPRDLDISPDGRSLAFDMPGGNSGGLPEYDVWTKRLAGGKPKRVSRGGWFPTYSPAGDTIAYANYSGLWTRKISGPSRPKLLLKAEYLPMEGEGKLLVQPAWQPLP